MSGGGGNIGPHLSAYLERIERVAEERDARTADINAIYGEAKSNGLDVKAMRKIVAMRKQDGDKRKAEAETLDIYLAALGML